MRGNEIVGNRRNIRLRKETYLVKCPQRFVFGDPLYFEELNPLSSPEAAEQQMKLE